MSIATDETQTDEDDVTMFCGDCLDVMRDIPEDSVDMVLCDLPYGTTASKWDTIIDFDKLWRQYKRVIKRNGAIVLFASGRFTNELINSNPDWYRYKWVWVKTKKGNFVNANNRPLTLYEEICVFSKGVAANTKNANLKMKYNPQGLIEVNRMMKHSESKFGTMASKRPSQKRETIQRYTNYPCDVLSFSSVGKPRHPTQKPVDLLEYLIRTYTDEGDLVLDNCMGSGSTGVACKNTGRRFIGIEIVPEYARLSYQRITFGGIYPCEFIKLPTSVGGPEGVPQGKAETDNGTGVHSPSEVPSTLSNPSGKPLPAITPVSGASD